MTITIADGRGALWQWDTGRRVKIADGDGVKQVHYQNRCFGRSVDVDVGDDGTAIIPDELLQDCRQRFPGIALPPDIRGHLNAQLPAGHGTLGIHQRDHADHTPICLADNAVTGLSRKFLHQTVIFLIHCIKGMITAAIQRGLLIRENRKYVLRVLHPELPQLQTLCLDFKYFHLHLVIFRFYRTF